MRDGLVLANPVRTVSKFKEAGERLVWLSPDEETVVREALPADLRPLFTVSIHTGLRWGEQVALRWKDVDMLSGLLTVARSKHGYTRRVPANSLVRAALVDLGAGRARPDDAEEPVFPVRYTEASKFFPQAVERAQGMLRDAGKHAGRLDGYTWHCNRHTFASRLVMAGADLLTVKELGGWRTLAMVQRYAHLAPDHLAAAVERLVAGFTGEKNGKQATEDARTAAGGEPEAPLELRRNFNEAGTLAGGVS
jgi:site-specific recombinase XerD